MRVATLLSVVVFVGTALFCIWLIPDYVELHIYASGHDQSAVGSFSFSNDAEYCRRCQILREKGDTGDSRGAPGIRLWRRPKSANHQSAWCVNVTLWYPLLCSAALPAVWATRRLARSRFQFSMRTVLMAVFAIGFFLGSWALTQQVGIPAVLNHQDALLRGPLELTDHDGQRHSYMSKRVDRNPLDEGSPYSDTHCHYLANARSPFPLIVAFDCAKMTVAEPYHTGASARVYYLWLYGKKFPLDHWERPGKQVIYE